MQPDRPWAIRVSPKVAPTVQVKNQGKRLWTSYKTVDTPIMAMTFYLSVAPLDESAHSQCICCAELDLQLDVINSFVAIGNVLESAYLIDEEGVRLDLPIEAFNGASVVEGLRKLTRA
jgi:hypothetical protein